MECVIERALDGFVIKVLLFFVIVSLPKFQENEAQQLVRTSLDQFLKPYKIIQLLYNKALRGRQSQQLLVEMNFECKPWNIDVCHYEGRHGIQKMAMFVGHFLETPHPRFYFTQRELNKSVDAVIYWSNYCREKAAQPVQDDVKFPYDDSLLKRSESIPQNAHQVRPGDIDVIGAIGDSLTAGYGIDAVDILQILVENRGKSFSGGGEQTWRTVLTLPNILKVFNPNLIGFATKSSVTSEKESEFNVAEGTYTSLFMPSMAKKLVNRIKNDPRVNITRDWKMITHMIGDNDFCTEICYHRKPHLLLDSHKQDLLKVLRIFRDNLPRTIVNIVPPPNLSVFNTFNDKPPGCFISNSVECPCIVGLRYRNKQNIFYDIMRKWQLLDIEISNMPEFDLDNFTVIPHQFTLNDKFPTLPSGKHDFGLLSADCFHFSQRGQARFANDLWNSLMKPFGNKSTEGSDVFTRFECPTAEHPYIFTRRNSGSKWQQ